MPLSTRAISWGYLHMLFNASKAAHEASKNLVQALGQLHAELIVVNLPHIARRLADYAYMGVAFDDDNALSEALHEFASAEELLKITLMLPNGNVLWDEEDRQVIADLGKAARARQSLDQGESVTVDELAALARIAEKTVRMATNPAKPGSMRVTKDGHWAYIEASEALTWLGRRKDFIPTRRDSGAPQQKMIVGADDLADICRICREKKGEDLAELASSLGWTNAQREAYEQIEAGDIKEQMTHFPPQALFALAQHYDLQQPIDFAHQAYRLLAHRYADALSESQLPVDFRQEGK